MKRHYLQALVDPSAIEHNCRILQSQAGTSNLCIAIKADAYGHGVRIVLPILQKIQPAMLAVACIEEAFELRELNWTGPILLLGSETSAYPLENQQQIVDELVENEIRVTPTRSCEIEALAHAARKTNKAAYVHLDLDTGMCRMGLNETDLLELVEMIRRHDSIVIEGVYTHFATADSADKTFAMFQLSRFNRFLDRLKQSGMTIPIIHAANSGAVVNLPDAHFNMVRPGISVYGYQAGAEIAPRSDLKPALKVISFLTLIKTIPQDSFVGYGCTFQTRRPTVIGLVPIGYADGYFRELSNRGSMLIAGKPVPVIGRVSMDQTVVDLTDLVRQGLEPKPGDPTVIYDNRRSSLNSVENVAEMLETIPYVVTTALGRRVKRIPVFEQ